MIRTINMLKNIRATVVKCREFEYISGENRIYQFNLEILYGADHN